MAEQQQGSNIPSRPSVQNSFTGGMIKDLLDTFIKEGSYTYARNAANNLPDGVVGGISTEPATQFCVAIPYTLIGAIPLAESQWMLFFTDDTHSEIGLFTESTCNYTTITHNQPCLNFNRQNLITGASRRGFDCGFDVYWSDGGRNPDRFINTAKVPWVQACINISGCITCVDTNVLDCDKLRIAPHFSVPCLQLAKSQGSGQLLNGSYQVAVAYAINEIRCTDYIALSNIQSIFAHTDLAGAVKLTITGAETTNFTEMEVVLVSMINSQVQAKRLGIYSTSQTVIYIDNIDQTLASIDIATLPLNTPAVESSDSIYAVSSYLLRIGPRERPDFNYQPLANQIEANWACVEYPDNYYHKGGDEFGMNVGYMRDEVYAYFIRWVYTTGDKSASYPIPGLPAGIAPIININGPATGDSGTTLYNGKFAGYSSTEIYPDNQPTVWNSNLPGQPQYDLCGKPIMHHKFPDQTFNDELTHFTSSNTIRVMGVYFTNIKPPVDNNGNIIPDIQGFEILRAVREGHKSVLAKGMINHMRSYTTQSGVTGLYQNYPYDDLTADYYLTSDQSIATVGPRNPMNSNNVHNAPLTGVRSDIVSFHSPDTSFQQPYLGTGQLALYSALFGTTTGNFNVPYKHPKFKMLSNSASTFTNILGIIAGLGTVAAALGGNAVTLAGTNDLPIANSLGLEPIPDGPYGTISAALEIARIAYNVTIAVILLPIQVDIISQQLANVIKGLVPAHQYALQYDSHGFYNGHAYVTKSEYNINDYDYIRGYMQSFLGYDVNNLYRNNYVILALTNPSTGGAGTLPSLPGSLVDRSRFTLGDSRTVASGGGANGFGPWYSPIASWYGGYKVTQNAQYGQIDDAKQVPIGCMQHITPTTGASYGSSVLFGGDTYINRYTEKNPFMFFNDWLLGQPTDYEYNYTTYQNVPYPRFWVDNTNVHYSLLAAASRSQHLDEYDVNTGFSLPGLSVGLSFYVSAGVFYLFCNGVRDFYVESEINVGYRDWEDEIAKRFFDPYAFGTSNVLSYMFRSDVIKSDILYKYDFSLSASRFFNQYISWGQCLRRDYSPVLAYTCFAYYPRRIVYSLPQEEELKKDNWRIFLPNNYKDFPSKVTVMKDIHKTGAIILQDDQSPQVFTGVESIASKSNTEYSVGTGQLFSQAIQSIVNVDNSYQYGSCQNKFSVVNTPYGLFWASQRAGKLFNYRGGQMDDIGNNGLKWWLSKYLPSKLLEQYPDYPLYDNPVVGVGVQTIYDAVNEVVYFCKRDFKATNANYANGKWYAGPCPPGTMPTGHTSDPSRGISDCTPCGIVVGGKPCPPVAEVEFGDPKFFENCSWTLSYDCKNKHFISFHDWTPELNIPAKQHFLTSKNTALWRHNNNTGLFCNYYGVDYPFAIEAPLATGVTVNTIESIEYIMEAYNYKANQTDKFLQYSDGFDRAIVYNNEQSTLWMNLTLKPWNDPYAALNYPSIDYLGMYDVLYSKVENKYRFSNIKDFTFDRGQFTLTTTQLMRTDDSGFRFTLNPLYLDAGKSTLQQKKIRHYSSRVYLQKNIVGNNSMTLRYIHTNQQNSFR